MGLERTHAEFVGQGEGLAVMGFGGLALGVRGDAEVQVRQRVEGAIPAGRGQGEGTLGRGAGLVIVAHEVVMEREKVRDPSQATRVVEG